LWDGEKVISLANDPFAGDYNNIPRDFIVDDDHFSPDWWLDYLWVQYWWPSVSIRRQAVRNARQLADGSLATTFIHAGVTWSLTPFDDIFVKKDNKTYDETGVFTLSDFKASLSNPDNPYNTQKEDKTTHRCVLFFR
jgi:hypothetical protein